MKVCIVGAGPVGLYLSHLLLKQDMNAKIHVLEKAPLKGTPDNNAFGFGVGVRHEKFLKDIPGLWDQIKGKSAPVFDGKLHIIGRNTLCEELLTKLEEVDVSKRCNVSYETSCESIDFDQRVVTTSKGKKIDYDLLVASDGVNSGIRKMLVQDKGLTEEHYQRKSYWKSLKLPKQASNVLSRNYLKRMNHPSFKGSIIPRFPDGHSALIFWNDETPQNPKGIETSDDLMRAMTQVMKPKASKWDVVGRLFFSRFKDKDKTSDDFQWSMPEE